MPFFEVVNTLDLDFWRNRLAAPGGTGPIQHVERDGDLVKIHHDGTGDETGSARWQTAQQAEAEFWRGWRRSELYGDVSLADFWSDVLEKTGGPLSSGTILDIGCGPVSVLNFFRGEGVIPIGLDPLGKLYAREGLIETRQDWDPIPIAAIRSEKLPFTDGALDHLICFNVLDHVSDAPAVLAEMNRVLAPGGTARVYVHTFMSWIKRLLFFDKPHTYHWDHREFRTLMERAGFHIVHQLEEPKTFDLPPGLLGKIRHFPYWVATKVAFTSYFQIAKPEDAS